MPRQEKESPFRVLPAPAFLLLRERFERRGRVLLLLTLLFCLKGFVAGAQTYVPGQVYFGQNDYIEYHAGNLPIVITAPHGGTLEPSDIPDRTCGITGIDSRTQTLIREMEYEIFQLTGRYPHIVIFRLARKKMDANRNIDEATCGNVEAVPYWYEWHKYIDSAKAAITRDWGKGLFIDLHGHGHTIQRIEWGYLLSSTTLSYSDATLNLNQVIEGSSIRSLVNDNIGNQTHAQLLRGATSIGTMLADYGYAGIPSSSDPSPGTDPYFNGGYNTQRHSSRDGGTIDGIQLEAPSSYRTNHVNRIDFSNKFAIVALEYLKTHYYPDLELFYTWSSADQGISFDAVDAPYYQNFDYVFPGDQTHYLSENDPQFPGLYAFNTLKSTQPLEFRRYTVGLSTTGNGYLFNAGHSNNTSDRALGLIYSSTTGPLGFGLRFVNNTGVTITSLDVSYTGEQWRIGGSSTAVIPNTLAFEYMIADRATNIRNGDYISVPALDFISPNLDVASYQSPIDGNLSSNRAVISSIISLNILPGKEIMLRWVDRVDDSSYDHLLAVDDLTVTPRSVMTGAEVPISRGREIRLYPNPVSDILNIDTPGISDGVVSIYNGAGVCLLSSELNYDNLSIDVSRLAVGFYIVVVRRNQSVYGTAKFIRN